MPRLIKDGAIVEDRWTLLRDATSLADVPNGEPTIVPLALWLTERAALRSRAEIGVWLKPSDDPDLLAVDCPTLPLIAIDFPQFTDGRGYSIARQLRDRYGFAGELRAVGWVLRDQLFYMERCGFTAFELKAGKPLESALEAFGEFSVTYQAAADDKRPIYRRR